MRKGKVAVGHFVMQMAEPRGRFRFRPRGCQRPGRGPLITLAASPLPVTLRNFKASRSLWHLLPEIFIILLVSIIVGRRFSKPIKRTLLRISPLFTSPFIRLSVRRLRPSNRWETRLILSIILLFLLFIVFFEAVTIRMEGRREERATVQSFILKMPLTVF